MQRLFARDKDQYSHSNGIWINSVDLTEKIDENFFFPEETQNGGETEKRKLPSPVSVIAVSVRNEAATPLGSKLIEKCFCEEVPEVFQSS